MVPRLVRRYLGPQKRLLGLLGALLTVSTAARVLQPRLAGTFVDRAGAGASTDSLVRIGVATVGLAMGQQVLGVVDTYVAEHLAMRTTNRLRADLARHVLGLDAGFHGGRRPGELVQRIDGDTAELAVLLSRFALLVAANAILVLGVAGVLATLDLRLGLLALASAFAVPGLSWSLRKRAGPRRVALLEAKADHAGFLEEHLSALEDLRAAGAGPWVLRGLAVHGRRLRATNQASALVGGLGPNLGLAVFGAGMAGTLGLAVHLHTTGRLSVGDVFVVFVAGRALVDPVEVLGRHVEGLQTAVAAAGRIGELLATASALEDTGTDALPDGPPELALAGVVFSYGTGAEPVLRDVSLVVPPGRVLGIVGRTGSGKTTIARLLARFHDPQLGTVTLAGVDARRLPLGRLRSTVALVTQDVHLFHATVRENVRLFDHAVPDDRITAVLDQVGLGPWLAGLPDGLDTVVQASSGLSAGEAQLLGFARAFLRHPAAVILDEATARLDPATQARVEAATHALLAGRTGVVIAHRLATLDRVDDIAVVEAGRIVEHGPRAALAADPASRFARLLAAGEEVLAR